MLLRAGVALSLPLVLTRCGAPEDRGGLVPDPDGLLDLPEGFTYRVLQSRGDAMTDGYLVPGAPDGMGCFPGPDAASWVLMRNHELGTGGDGPYRPDQSAPPEAYDPRVLGGVTRLVVDAETLAVRSSNLVLAGTARNCAGGTSPWGWLTCEEDVSEGHGYVFLTDPLAEAVRPPRRVRPWGRMNHEAAVVHPATGIAYLTEDREDACFYRFVPDAPDEMPDDAATGRLQALRIVGQLARDLNVDLAAGARLAAEWVDLPDPLAADDSLRRQGRDAGAAIFRRGEGVFLDGDAVLLCATTGGPQGAGQIWKYTPADGAGGELALVAQSEDRTRLDMPDNLCVAPWGDIVIAEDGADLRWPEEHLRVITPGGQIVNLARNARSQGEFAGVCFSPDASVLFCNLQRDGLTVAIRGPFEGLAARRGSSAASRKR